MIQLISQSLQLKKRNKAKLIFNIASGIVGLTYLGFNSYCYVPEGHHMLIKNNLEVFDKEQRPKEEGYHLIKPIIEQPVIIKTEMQVYQNMHNVYSKEDIKFKVKLEIKWQPVLEKLAHSYYYQGARFEGATFPEMGRFASRLVLMEYTRDEINGSLNMVIRDDIQQRIQSMAQDVNIIVHDVDVQIEQSS